MEYSMFTEASSNYWGSAGQSFSYLCAVMLFAKSTAAAGLKRRIAAIGQMALTN